MSDFENRVIKGIHVSRYIASWVNAGGTRVRYLNKTEPTHCRIETTFADWLRTLVINDEHLTEDEVRYITNFAENGKLELEHSAMKFLEK